MARPKKARIADRVILAMRERFMQLGSIAVREVREKKGKRWEASRVLTQTYGPDYVPPPGFVQKTIHAGRGRPPHGAIGLVQALAAVSGYSERVVARALAGHPRAGTQRLHPRGCPMCGHAEPTDPEPPDHHEIARSVESLSAVGLRSVGLPQKSPPDPLREIRRALVDALDGALAMGAVTGEAERLSDRLLAVLRPEN